MSGDLPVGRRVAYWRGRRGWSQQTLADALGMSKSWVDKVERGVRRLDRLSTLREVARALRIDVDLLLGTGPAAPVARADPSDGPLTGAELDPLRAALFRFDAALAGADGTGPTPDRIRAGVEHAWSAYGHADYRLLVRILPGLLCQAQLTRAAHPDDPVAVHLLGQVTQLVSAVLCKLGELATSWLAADRAMTIGRRTADPTSAAVTLTRVLRALDRPRHALEVAVAVAHRIGPPDPQTAPAERHCGYGSLLVQAARAAAASGDHPGTVDLLDQAAAVAARLGDDHHCRTSFGPTAVGLARVTTALALDRDRDPLRSHRELLDTVAFARLTVERRAAYLVDVARGCLRRNDLPEAARALLLADRTAPTEVRHRPTALATLRTLLRRASRPDPELTRLAETLRIAL
ncbi:helix-turn-helix domain-containing protein [Micromonospora sp. NPDC000207]|uniref:helix-turn-helix domain-containing protein n=1 Tax=Micromonospora sp. NPDC000207 TaxID=3154246 RepID=UPI00331830EC